MSSGAASSLHSWQETAPLESPDLAVRGFPSVNTPRERSNTGAAVTDTGIIEGDGAPRAQDI